MMYSGLCHLAVCIEADIATVVSTLVGHENRWTVIVCYTMFAVMWSRSWSGMMHSRNRCGLVHVGIV